VKRGVNLQLLFNDRNQYLSAYDAPDLRLHGVLADVKKVLDAQVLLGPLEKQFDLLAAFVKIGNGGGGQRGGVFQKDQCVVGGRVMTHRFLHRSGC